MDKIIEEFVREFSALYEVNLMKDKVKWLGVGEMEARLEPIRITLRTFLKEKAKQSFIKFAQERIQELEEMKFGKVFLGMHKNFEVFDTAIEQAQQRLAKAVGLQTK